MGDGDFSVDLGQGWYLDANGRLHSQPLPSTATYAAHGTVPPFDPKAIREAFKDVNGVLPDKGDPKSIARFEKLGLPKELIDFLARSIGSSSGVPTGCSWPSAGNRRIATTHSSW